MARDMCGEEERHLQDFGWDLKKRVRLIDLGVEGKILHVLQ
jgi:hypothetical protein